MKLKILLAICFYLISFGLLFTTNPQNLPLIILILPFISLFSALFFTAEVVITQLLPKNSRVMARKKSMSGLVAAFPVICLLLLSIGQFSIRDLVTILLLFVLLWFYLTRLSRA